MTDPQMDGEFGGAKLALFLGARLLVIERDDIANIPFPGHWDLPGGGREGQELPQECAVRETHEEVGLRVDPDALVWARSYELDTGTDWFFVAHLPAEAAGDVRFGNEGRGWALMTPAEYCEHRLAVPHLVARLQLYLRN